MSEQLTDELTAYVDRLTDCVGLVNAIIYGVVEKHPLLPSAAVDKVTIIADELKKLRNDLYETITAVNRDLIPF